MGKSNLLSRKKLNFTISNGKKSGATIASAILGKSELEEAKTKAKKDKYLSGFYTGKFKDSNLLVHIRGLEILRMIVNGGLEAYDFHLKRKISSQNRTEDTAKRSSVQMAKYMINDIIFDINRKIKDRYEISKSEYEFEQIVDDFAFLTRFDSFREYYSHFLMLILDGQNENEDYEHMIMRRRGMQMSYFDKISSIEQEIGVDMSKEKERYWHMFYDEPEESFASLLAEVEEGLSFIKSNRVNTYELLFEADEMMRLAEETESENAKLVAQAANEFSEHAEPESDEEAKALLDDPEEMIKLLKKRRGI